MMQTAEDRDANDSGSVAAMQVVLTLRSDTQKTDSNRSRLGGSLSVHLDG
jgi:hypothetical protein